MHVVVGDFYSLEEKKKLIQYLLDEGAKVNARDSFGKTPLHKSYDAGVTQILLDAGANPFIKNCYGMTARDFTYGKEKQLLKKAENKYKYKAMGVGAICGAITALAVGGGCFADGVALPILALVGIAVAALVTGLVAVGTTYAISSKMENPDTSRLATEQGLPQQS